MSRVEFIFPFYGTAHLSYVFNLKMVQGLLKHPRACFIALQGNVKHTEFCLKSNCVSENPFCTSVQRVLDSVLDSVSSCEFGSE